MKSGPPQEAVGLEGAVKPALRGKSAGRTVAARWEAVLLLVWFAANLTAAVLTVHQYGVSFDEPNNYRYAADTLAAYKTLFGTLGRISYNSSYDGHGPAFMAGMLFLIRGIQGVFPGSFQPDLFHFSYFVTFQLTGLCLYVLMKRWFRAYTAWAVLVLFDTQPLLLGHAFINPKDIPFMLFFTASILLGFRIADGIPTDEQFLSLRPALDWLRPKLQETKPGRRRRFFSLAGIVFAMALTLAIFSGPINGWLEQAVKFFYRAAPDSWSGRVFSFFAGHAGEATARDYVNRAQQVFRQVEGAALIMGLLLFAAYFCVTFPAVLRSVWDARRQMVGALRKWWDGMRNALSLRSLRSGLAAAWSSLRQPRVLLAGVMLGVATSVRAVAPWAGGIAFLYLLARARSKAWATGAAYFLLAAVVTFLTWPRLWGSPLQRYWAGIHTISNFVAAQHVLFNGRVYPATGLPASYVFTLLNLQFTEPLLACTYIGVGILLWQLLRSRVRTDLLLYVLLGFAAPLIGWQVTRSPLYDNLRQLLFLMPAMLVLAAFTLEWLVGKLRQPLVRAVLIAALALPGLYASATLYPYGYNYYNSLVGGVAGARRLYTMDPWRTSLREISLALNERAPAGATVLAGPWAEIMSLYARSDLVLETEYSSSADQAGEYDYTVEVPNVKPWKLHHQAHDVFTISRDGATLGTLQVVDNATAK